MTYKDKIFCILSNPTEVMVRTKPQKVDLKMFQNDRSNNLIYLQLHLHPLSPDWLLVMVWLLIWTLHYHKVPKRTLCEHFLSMLQIFLIA